MSHKIFDLLDPNLYPEAPPLYVPRRFIVAILLFLGTALVYFQRVTTSLAILQLHSDAQMTALSVALMLCVYYIGHLYCTTGYHLQRLVDRPRDQVLASLALASPLYLTFPFTMLTGHSPASIAFPLCWLFLAGLFHSLFAAGAIKLVSNWFPRKEYHSMLSLSLLGMQFGIIAATGFGPLIVRQYDWQSLYFIAGGFGLIFAILWFIFVSSLPHIDADVLYTPCAVEVDSILDAKQELPVSNPKHLLYLAPVWAYWVNQFASLFTFYFFLAWLPFFLETEIVNSLKVVQTFTFLPYLFCFVVQIGSGFAFEKLTEHAIPPAMTKLSARILFQSLSNMITLVALLIIVFVPYHKALCVLALIIAISSWGLSVSGMFGYALDLCDSDDAFQLVFGGGHIAGNVAAIISIFSMGLLLEYYRHYSWDILFLICCLLLMVASLAWLFCLSDTHISQLLQDIESKLESNQDVPLEEIGERSGLLAGQGRGAGGSYNTMPRTSVFPNRARYELV